MKKALSLILAVLMSAVMAPAVFADEAAIMPISEEEGQIVETVAEEAAEEESLVVDIVVMDKEVVITPAHIAAIAAAQGITVTEEEVAAVIGETELTAETAAAALTALGYTVTAEEAAAAVYAVAAPIEKYEITEFSTGFALILCQALNVSYEAEIVDAFMVVEESGLLAPALFINLMNEVGLAIDEAGFYDVAISVLDYLKATYETVETPVEAVEEEAVVEEVVEEEAVVEEIAEEEAVVEEVVEEEVSKFPVILEETPTFGLFTKILSPFTFRG